MGREEWIQSIQQILEAHKEDGFYRWMSTLNYTCPNPVPEVCSTARFSVLPGTCVHLPGRSENPTRYCPRGLDLGTPSESTRGASTRPSLPADPNITGMPNVLMKIIHIYACEAQHGAAPEM